MSFIAGKTNRQISAKEPKAYFPSMLEKAGGAAFESQCIPTDEKLLAVDAYKDFLKRRRELIAKRLNEFLMG